MSRYFGFELEFDNNRIEFDALKARFDRSLQFAHFGAQLCNMESPRTWTIKGDPSCGHEITTPALDACPEVFARLKVLMDHFEEQRIQSNSRPIVTSRCGLHVHISIMSLDPRQIRNLIRVFHNVEDNIMALCPPSRRGRVHLFSQDDEPLSRWINNFNADSGHRDYDTRDQGYGQHMFNRRGMHLGKLHSSGTFEARYQGGTSRAGKTINWIKYLLYLVEISKNIQGEGPVEILSFEDHLSWIMEGETRIPWMEDDKTRMINWLRRRKAHLGNIHARQTVIREQNDRIRAEQRAELEAQARESARMGAIDAAAQNRMRQYTWGENVDDDGVIE